MAKRGGDVGIEGLRDRVQVLEKRIGGLQIAIGGLESQLKGALKVIAHLQDQLKAVEAGSLKSGEFVSLMCRNEFLTWMTSGGEVKSRATSFIPNMQTWLLQRRPSTNWGRRGRGR
ncbi:MAG: hypothetical protein AB7O44_01455 [Hyphomicrobiaceae bacterium]